MSNPRVSQADTVFGVTTTDPFGIVTGGKFVIQSLNKNTSRSVAITQGATGEYETGSAVSVGGQVETTAEYKAKVNDTISAQTINVADQSGFIITSATINLRAGDHATMSISGHKHEAADGSVSPAHDNTSQNMTLPAIPGFGAGNFGLDLGVDDDAIQSATMAISMQHADEQNKDGNHLCGHSFAFMVTATFEAVDATQWDIPDGWTVQSGNLGDDMQERNTAFKRRTLTIVKYLSAPGTIVSSGSST